MAKAILDKFKWDTAEHNLISELAKEKDKKGEVVHKGDISQEEILAEYLKIGGKVVEGTNEEAQRMPKWDAIYDPEKPKKTKKGKKAKKGKK